MKTLLRNITNIFSVDNIETYFKLSAGFAFFFSLIVVVYPPVIVIPKNPIISVDFKRLIQELPKTSFFICARPDIKKSW